MNNTPPSEAPTLTIRAAAFVAMGCALVTGWLRPLYELWVARSMVAVPEWWYVLHIVALVTLFVAACGLRKHDQRLYNAACGAFVISLLAHVVPGFS